MEFKFELGIPFKPFQQLMGVLPFASRDHIPLAYQVSSFTAEQDFTNASDTIGLDVRPKFPDSGLLPPRF